MADVVGVAASVAGLVTIADSVVRKGFKFIWRWKNYTHVRILLYSATVLFWVIGEADIRQIYRDTRDKESY